MDNIPGANLEFFFDFNQIGEYDRVFEHLGFDSVGNSIPLTATNTSQPPILTPNSDLSSSPPEADGKGKLVEQRRAKVKQSEQKRRNRLNDLMKDLETLVFPENAQKGKRITKEEILQQAISILGSQQEQQQQLFPDEIQFRELNDLSPNNDQTIVQQEESRLSVSQNDAETTFRVLFFRTIHNLITLQSTKNKQRFLILLHELEELAQSTGKPQLQLRVSVLEEMFYSMVNFHPQEHERANNRSILLYRQLKSTTTESKIRIPFPPAEIGLFILVNRAQILAVKGKFDRATKVFSSAKTMALQSEDPVNRDFYYSGLAKFYYQMGEPVPYNDASEAFQRTTANLQPLSRYVLGMAMLDHTNNPTEKLQGAKLVKEGIDAFSQLAGPIGAICLSAYLIYSYLRSGLYDEGIRCADEILHKSMETGITGTVGRSEIQRLKGELLLSKYRDILNNDIQIVRNIQQTLLDSLSSAQSIHAHTSYLKASISYANFLLMTRNATYFRSDLQEGVQLLKKSLSLIDPSPRSSLITTANSLLDQLVSLSSTTSTPTPTTSSPTTASPPSYPFMFSGGGVPSFQHQHQQQQQQSISLSYDHTDFGYIHTHHQQSYTSTLTAHLSSTTTSISNNQQSSLPYEEDDALLSSLLSNSSSHHY